MNRTVALHAGRAADTIAVALYDVTGLACLLAHHTHNWLAPRIARLEADQTALRALKRARKETGRYFQEKAKRLGWTVEDLRAIRDGWTGSFDQPEPEPWVNDGHRAREYGLLMEEFEDFEAARARLRAEVDARLDERHPSLAMAEPAPTVEYLNRLLGVDPDGVA
jgi:hypothetical protein